MYACGLVAQSFHMTQAHKLPYTSTLQRKKKRQCHTIYSTHSKRRKRLNNNKSKLCSGNIKLPFFYCLKKRKKATKASAKKQYKIASYQKKLHL